MVVKELGGSRYALHGNIVLDTVPFELAEAWLDDAAGTDTLILCGANPYPKTVQLFAQTHPGARILATHYTAYTLSGILGNAIRFELVRDKRALGDLTLTVESRPGGGSFLTAACCGNLYRGEETAAPAAEKYEAPTVAIVYVSGCDYTETAAEKIAEGIREAGGLRTSLIDLAGREASGVIASLVNAAGILLGTPTLNGDAPKKMWDLLTAMPRDVFQKKPASVFGACTWNGDAVPHVLERLRQLDMDVMDGGFTMQYRPDEAAMNAAYEYGYYYGCKLLGIPNTHRSGLVKCLVCGEIFDASLGLCPVCGVGLDKCVPVEDEVIGHKENTRRTYVIAGGGTAALNAAEAIRKRDETGRIVLISAEDTAPINRPMLSKNLAMAAQVEDALLIHDPAWFTERGLELRLRTSVTAIDPDEKTVTLSDDTLLPYDRLILATGAECFIPPITGADKNGVFTLRHLADAKKLWSYRGGGKKAVVIGGGVLGLEAASELRKMHLDVTVLELAPQIMGRQLDGMTAEALMSACASFGVPVHTGVSITALTGDADVQGVLLADGTEYPAQLVVLSCGNRANSDAAKAAGSACGRAIKVNDRMETSLPDIYAAGDCAELEGVNMQLWSEASQQGRTAGANAAGDAVRYSPTPMGASFEGMNARLFAIGDVGKGGLDYRLVSCEDGMTGAFRRFWFVDRKLVGGILFGDTALVPELTEAMEKSRTYEEIRGILF